MVNLTPPFFAQGTLQCDHKPTKRKREKTKHTAANGHFSTEINYPQAVSLSKHHWNNSSLILRDMQESRLCQVKVLARGIAPPTIFVRQCVVRGAEIGDGDSDGAPETPLGVTIALELVARSTARALVEHYGAQGGSLCPISLAVHVPVPTSSPCRRKPSLDTHYRDALLW